MGRKIALKRRLEKYEDFYNRAFSDVDVNKIFQEGGGASLPTFKETARGKMPKDYWKEMFNRDKVKKKDKLGEEIFKRFFQSEVITKNIIGRIIVRTGETFKFKEKTYKGGMFVPRAFLTSRF